MQYDTLKALLKQSGASLTKPRKIVFDLLANQEAQTLQVLISRAKKTVDRATIYRTIELFEKLGIVNRLNVGWKYKVELSDVFSDHHHHMHCNKCGAIITLPGNTMLETMISTLASKGGFSPSSHQLEVYGLCPSCSGQTT